MKVTRDTHLQEGELRAWLDHELLEAQRQAADAHLAGCPTCQEKAEALRQRAALVGARLETLAPPVIEQSPAARGALHAGRLNLDAYMQRKEQATMFDKLFARRFRPAWAAVGVVLVLALALAFPQVRALAVDFLGLFRVQQVTVVPVDAEALSTRLGSSQQLEQLFADGMQMEVLGESREVGSAAEASELAGIAVRLPEQLGSPSIFNVEPAASLRFTVDVEQLNLILQELGSDLELPADLDGAEVTADLPSMVYTAFGECKQEMAGPGAPDGYDPDDPATWPVWQCTTLVQMASPTVEAPAGLDLTQLGQTYLQILGMSAEEAQRFSENVDWATTLVVPLPMRGVEYQEVTVDGVMGTLAMYQGAGRDYLLIWVKDGVVYALQGPGSASEAVEIAGSLK